MGENSCPRCDDGVMVPAPKYHPTDRTSKWVCHNCDYVQIPEPDWEAMANDY